MQGLVAKSILASVVVLLCSKVGVSQEGQLVEPNITGPESKSPASVMPFTELQIACEEEFLRLVEDKNQALKDSEADFRALTEELGLDHIPNDEIAKLVREIVVSKELKNLRSEQIQGQREVSFPDSKPGYENSSYYILVSRQIERKLETIAEEYHFDGFEISVNANKVRLVRSNAGITTEIMMDLEDLLSRVSRGHKPKYKLRVSKREIGRNLSLLSATIDPSNPSGVASKGSMLKGLSCGDNINLRNQQIDYRVAMADLKPILEYRSSTTRVISTMPLSSPGHTLLHEEQRAYDLPVAVDWSGGNCSDLCRASAK